MPHVLQVLFLSVFILQIVMHGEESQVPTKNVIYGIECTLCGLLYVGETHQTLRSRMNQHRYDARDPKYRILYNHFNQPGHDRCLTMRQFLFCK
jgi:hypothetical protein